jgi:hypothetical protein
MSARKLDQPHSDVVKCLIKRIHADGKEHPYESGQLARLVGRSIRSNPWVKGSGPHNGFRAGWKNPPNPENIKEGA